MRSHWFALSVMTASLAMAGSALAFDSNMPMDEAAQATFPIMLSDVVDDRMTAAFFAAFAIPYTRGADAKFETVHEGRSYVFSPAAMELLDDDRAVLLSVGALADAGHSDGGMNAIHYLKHSPQGWVRDGAWFGLGSVGTVGNGATSWAITRLLGKNPYLITAGGGVWQGCMISTAVVTELMPSGPVDRGSFTDAMSSGAGIGQQEAQFDGVIAAAKPNKSFTVQYRGSKSLKLDYVLRDGKYTLVGRDHIPGC